MLHMLVYFYNFVSVLGVATDLQQERSFAALQQPGVQAFPVAGMPWMPACDRGDARERCGQLAAVGTAWMGIELWNMNG